MHFTVCKFYLEKRKTWKKAINNNSNKIRWHLNKKGKWKDVMVDRVKSETVQAHFHNLFQDGVNSCGWLRDSLAWPGSWVAWIPEAFLVFHLCMHNTPHSQLSIAENWGSVLALSLTGSGTRQQALPLSSISVAPKTGTQSILPAWWGHEGQTKVYYQSIFKNKMMLTVIF